MNLLRNRWALRLILVVACLSLAGSAAAQHPRRHHWRETDTHAPATFRPWSGAPGIALPAPRGAFEHYLKHIGAKWFVAGAEAGARLPDLPQSNDRPHEAFALAIEFYFADEDRGQTEPGFIAFLDGSGRVVYVETNFARNAH